MTVSWDPRDYNESETVSSGDIAGTNETDTISEVRRGRGKSEHSKEWEDDDEAEEGEEEEEDAEEQEGKSESDISVKIEINHGGKTLHVVSVVGEDSLLYIYQMGTNVEKFVSSLPSPPSLLDLLDLFDLPVLVPAKGN